MNPSRFRKPGLPDPLSETAAAYLLRAERGDMSRAEQEELEAWLEVPEHARAYEDAIWALDAVQLYAGSYELMEMRDAALEYEPKIPAKTPLVAALTALAATVLIGLIWFVPRQQEQAIPVAVQEQPDLSETHLGVRANSNGIYRTGVGQSLSFILPDGSVATLDTDSRIKLDYDAGERGVRLLNGQAFFEVAKGQKKPFNVYAGDSRITATGTAFNVRLEGRRVRVDMTEGEVLVTPVAEQSREPSPSQVVTLRAGESFVAGSAAKPTVSTIEIAKVATWRDGLVVFQDEKLIDAVEEINRYAETPILVDDPSIRQLRLTGAFKTTEPERFAQAMTEIFPLESRVDSKGQVHLLPAD